MSGNIFNVSSTVNETYQLYDFTGKFIQQGAINVGENSIQIPQLPEGIYLIKIGNQIHKLIYSH